MKDQFIIPEWAKVAMFIMICACLWICIFKFKKLDLQVHQLKQVLTGPERNLTWNGGHTSVAVIKHSPDCECLK